MLDPMAQYKIDYELNQFEFIIFIPNPPKNIVTFFIDDGQMESSMYIEEFLKKLEKVCGKEEMNRIDMACHDYGVPYFYDRHKKILRELSPMEEPRSIRALTSMGISPQNSSPLMEGMKVDTSFNTIRIAIDQLSSYGLPNFSPMQSKQFKRF